MSKRLHLAYTVFLLLVGLAITVQVARTGFSYYGTSIEERPFRADYDLLKPTGLYGHAYGIIGAAMITLGVVIYSGRKRMRLFANVGKIKYYLEFHIFLCLLGPVLVLFHTTFKFGGLEVAGAGLAATGSSLAAILQSSGGLAIPHTFPCV